MYVDNENSMHRTEFALKRALNNYIDTVNLQ